MLPPGQRTVAAPLSGIGLLGLFVTAPVPSGPVVVDVKSRSLLDGLVPDIDETLERYWGARIKARGIQRGRVRSSLGHSAKASGLR